MDETPIPTPVSVVRRVGFTDLSSSHEPNPELAWEETKLAPQSERSSKCTEALIPVEMEIKNWQEKRGKEDAHNFKL